MRLGLSHAPPHATSAIAPLPLLGAWPRLTAAFRQVMGTFVKSLWVAPARALLLAFALLSLSFSAQAANKPTALDFGDGYQARLIGAGDTPARVGNPKVIYVSVALLDDKIHADHRRLIEAADLVFESVLMGAAENGYYRRAKVSILRTDAKTFEDFLYLRGEDEVWLRQAGVEPWKVAQDRKAWTPPATEKLQVPGYGAFAVETAIEVAPPEGFHRAAEIDFVTPTPTVNTQRKYQEIKALWSRMNQAGLKAQGFDIILLGNFSTPPKGRFHARKGFFVRIPREANGDWPPLPDRAPEDQKVLISKSDVHAQKLAMSIAETFAKGFGQRVGSVIATPRLAQTDLAHSSPPLSSVGLGQGRALLSYDPTGTRKLSPFGQNDWAVYTIDPSHTLIKQQ